MPSKTTAKAGAPSLAELQEEIKAESQRIYSERMSSHAEGDELSDWLAAEAKVKAKHKIK
jgi:hypothetical protein